MKSEPLQQKRFNTLDAFRGISATMIVFFHLHIIDSFTQTAAIKGTWIFVEFFFVLSGFVIAHSYGFKANFNLVNAIKSRFFRIFPLYFFMLGVILCVELFKFIGNNYFSLNFPGNVFTGRTALKELIYNVSMLQAWVPWANSYSFNYPSWSISVEFYIYAIFFISIYFTRDKLKPLIWFLIPILVALYVFLFLDLSSIKTEILRGIPCFFLGTLTYFVYLKIANANIEYIKVNRLIASILEITILLWVIWLIPFSSKPNLMTYTVSVASFSALILLFAFEAGCVSSFLKKPGFLLLGKLSYSIYLTHTFYLFLITLLTLCIDKTMGTSFLITNNTMNYGSSLINNFAAMVVVICVIIGSYFTYKQIELRWQAIGKRLNK